MGTVNSRDGKLYLDFRYKGLRCREQTKLTDTPANRQKLAKVLAMLEQQIKTGTFDYGHHFPDSPRIEHFRKVELLGRQKASVVLLSALPPPQAVSAAVAAVMPQTCKKERREIFFII